MEGVIGLAILQGESLVTEIRGLDAKGSGQAVVWRENELGNAKKLKLTIPRTLPGEKYASPWTSRRKEEERRCRMKF